jgi:hypothetical protein
VEEATLLSPIVVVPKKMGSLKFAWISKNWTLPRKKIHILYILWRKY